MKLLIQSKLKGAFFKKLLKSYLTLFIVPLLIIVVVFYAYITPMIYKKDVDYSYSILVHVVNATDMVLDEVNMLALNCAVNDDFQKVTNSNMKSDTYFISKVAQKVANIKNANENLYSAYLYLWNKDKIIDSVMGYYDIEDFYDNAWIKDYNDGSRGTAILSRTIYERYTSNAGYKETHVISLIMELKNHAGAIVLNIKESAFRAILRSLSGGDGNISVINGQGAVISQYEPDNMQGGGDLKELSGKVINQEGKGYFVSQMNGEEKLVSYVTSERNDWIYTRVLDVSSLKTASWEITLVVFAVAFLCICTGIIGAYAYSRRFYSPVERLLGNLRGKTNPAMEKDQSNIDEFNFINATINEIISKEENIEEMLLSSSELAKEQFLQKLVKGESGDADELKKDMTALNIRFRYDSFAAMVVEFDEWGKLSYYIGKKDIIKAKEFIKKYIEQGSASNGYDLTAHSFELRRIVLIVNFLNSGADSGNLGILSDIAGRVKQSLENSQVSTVTIGIGEPVFSIGELFKSYYQSCYALECSLLYGKSQILQFNDIQLGKRSNWLDIYTAEFSNGNLKELVMSLNCVQISLLFDRTVERLTALGANRMYIKFLFLQYIGMLSRVPFELGLELPENYNERTYANAVQCENIEEMKSCIGKIATETVEAYQKQNEKDAIVKIVEEAKAYIEKNFDSDIGLEQVAEKVFVSKYYLSRVFKIKTGTNFIDYLNNIRIQKAKGLLIDSDDDINTISRKVGYDSPNSFGRMFKSKVGISPSLYREKSRHRKNQAQQ